MNPLECPVHGLDFYFYYLCILIYFLSKIEIFTISINKVVVQKSGLACAEERKKKKVQVTRSKWPISELVAD